VDLAKCVFLRKNIHYSAEEAGPAPGEKRKESKQKRKGKELCGSFALLRVRMRLGALRLPGRREDSSDKYSLTKGTGNEIECRFNDLIY